MSRSNTRSRRAQWKATAPALVACDRCREPKLPHVAVPDLRHLQRPPGPRRLTGRLSAQPSAGGPRRPAATGSPSCSDVSIDPGLLEPRADPPLVRLRERRPADQRAAGVPRRLGARPGRHRHAVPHPPRPARGPAGQAAGRRRQHARARRRRPRPRRSGDFVRLGRGEETTGGRDKSSILADTARGAHRRRLPRPAASTSRPRLVHRLFDPLIDAGGRPRRRPGLEDQPAGADRRRRPRRPGVRRRRGRPGPREDLHAPSCRVGGEAVRRRAPAAARRRPSRRPPRPPGGTLRAQLPATRRRRRPRPDRFAVPELPEVEVVRRGLEPLGGRPHGRRRRGRSTRGPSAATPPARPTSPAGSRGRTVAARRAARQVPLAAAGRPRRRRARPPRA